jgi:hypothetical protein
MYTLFYNMVSSFGVIPISVTVFLKFKNGELLLVRVGMTHAVNYLKNYKYCHFSLNIFFHFLPLSSRIEVALHFILIFIILTHVTT